jgi:hypothetical protein
MTGLRAVGGVGVTSHFNLQVLKGCTVIRFEEVVQNLASLRLRVIDQQPRRGSGADPTYPLKNSAFSRAIDFDFGFLKRLLAGR